MRGAKPISMVAGILLSLSWLLGVGCSDSPPATSVADDPILMTPVWQLDVMIVDGEKRELVPDHRVTAEWTRTQVNGHGGCNGYSGTISLENGKIQMSDIMTTLIGCEGPINEQESAYVGLLQQMTEYEVIDGRLILSDSQRNNVLEFVAFDPQHAPLDGTTWILTHFTREDELVSSAQSVEEEIEIELLIRQGRVSGFGGSSAFRGFVVTDGADEIHFQSLEADEPEADARLSEQQSRFLDGLRKVNRYKIEEQGLTVWNNESGEGLQFRAE